MNTRRVHELYEGRDNIKIGKDYFLVPDNSKSHIEIMDNHKKRINVLALGDVGGSLLIGLRLMGASVCETIGIYDLNPKVVKRYEQEINQITGPRENNVLPKVVTLDEKDLFDCHIFVFCATAGIAAVGEKVSDVRMAQYEKNKKIAQIYGKMAKERSYRGDILVMSDPVDQLCQVFVDMGLDKNRVRGLGLGVMNARAAYYDQSGIYAQEGRVFGPHGENLVVANSIAKYDEAKSLELTKLTIEANKALREIGFKPYLAPALSSGALSIVELLEGNWHYSSVDFGSGFLGLKNKITKEGTVVEDLPIPQELFNRIEEAYIKASVALPQP